MLPKNNRITRKEFPVASTQGFRVFSPFFTVVVYRNKENTTKATIVVSKKISKSAVVRNKTKRVFYEVVQKFIPQITSPSLLVVYPKKEYFSTKFSVLVDEFRKNLSKSKIIK